MIIIIMLYSENEYLSANWTENACDRNRFEMKFNEYLSDRTFADPITAHADHWQEIFFAPSPATHSHLSDYQLGSRKYDLIRHF